MAMDATWLSPELCDTLTKVAVFVLVQALVYLILSKSSGVFSRAASTRSRSFRPMRSISVKRMLAALSDVPVSTDEPSPPTPSPRRRDGRED